ncbi:MAG: hypothetical protein M1839_007170 [Geoglossum umbratile]|nr:MAG: hypothetical protein M1839_007170 [Geoglossum umbratile]
MFFEGDLQSGIALAIRQSKMLDATEESLTWENEYLNDDAIAALLRSRAILLHMEAGSQEAKFLSAFCPVAKVPTLVAIYDGQLRASLGAGITREQFVERLKKVLQPQLEPEGATTSPIARGSAPSVAATHTVPTTESPIALSPDSPEATGRGAQPSAVQTLLAERRTRLEAQKRAQDAAEKQERIAKAKERREAAEAAEAPPGSAKARNANYVQQQRKKQLEAKQERERIMKLVENDKVERREREERRKALAAMTTGKSTTPESDVPAAQLPRVTERSTAAPAREFPIQIRLLDGSTIRTRFPPSATLRGDVRSWVDQQRSDGDTPYTFKQILTPLPNRAVTISEEEESLRALGLTPSATLVLVPVPEYTDAYRAGSGLLSGGISAGYSLVSSGAGMVSAALGSLLGIGRSAVPQDDNASFGQSASTGRGMQDEPPTGPANLGPGGNIRTLRDREADGDRQWYNGNQVRYQIRNTEHFVVVTDAEQLNFEPNRDDDGKED